MSWLKSVLTFPNLRDRPCWRCGYTLRNLPLDARNCPECGLAVRITLSANASLSFADPAWLGRLSLASFALAVTILLTVGVTLLYWLVLEPLGAGAWGAGMGPASLLLTI